MKRIFCLILLMTFGLVGSLAYAQGSSATSNARLERVHQLIVARLATSLDLSEDKAQQLGVILRQYQQRKKSLGAQVRGLTAQLRQQTQQGDNAAIQSTLGQLQKAREQLERSDEVMFEQAKAILTPKQQAQFVLVMDEIRHEIRAAKRRQLQRQVPLQHQVAPKPPSNKFINSYAPGN